MAQVISFEERAVATLRDRLGAAESAREDLIAFARGHSGATAAIHIAALELMRADSLDAMFKVVTQEWPTILGLDHVVVALVADGAGFRVHDGGVGTVDARIVDRAIGQIDPITMRTVECGHPLFGASAKHVRSEGLIVIGDEAPLPYGILLLGQHAKASLDNRHGTQLLGFLGECVGAMMRRWLIQP